MCSLAEALRRLAGLALAAGALCGGAPAAAQPAAPATVKSTTAPALPVAPAAARLPGLGRPATASELTAWDIDVRPDFKGLPAGSGTVAQGQDLWESKCASCHGVFGELNSEIGRAHV